MAPSVAALSFISLFFLLPPFLPLRSLAAGKPFDDSPPLRDLRHIAIGIAGSQTGESLGGAREGDARAGGLIWFSGGGGGSNGKCHGGGGRGKEGARVESWLLAVPTTSRGAVPG